MWHTPFVWVSLCVSTKTTIQFAHLSAQVLIGHDNHIGRISHGSGGSPDVGEDYLCNQDMSGVQIQHLTQPAGQNREIEEDMNEWINQQRFGRAWVDEDWLVCLPRLHLCSVSVCEASDPHRD